MCVCVWKLYDLFMHNNKILNTKKRLWIRHCMFFGQVSVCWYIGKLFQSGVETCSKRNKLSTQATRNGGIEHCGG